MPSSGGRPPGVRDNLYCGNDAESCLCPGPNCHFDPALMVTARLAARTSCRENHCYCPSSECRATHQGRRCWKNSIYGRRTEGVDSEKFKKAKKKKAAYETRDTREHYNILVQFKLEDELENAEKEVASLKDGVVAHTMEKAQLIEGIYASAVELMHQNANLKKENSLLRRQVASKNPLAQSVPRHAGYGGLSRSPGPPNGGMRQDESGIVKSLPVQASMGEDAVVRQEIQGTHNTLREGVAAPAQCITSGDGDFSEWLEMDSGVGGTARDSLDGIMVSRKNGADVAMGTRGNGRANCIDENSTTYNGCGNGGHVESGLYAANEGIADGSREIESDEVSTPYVAGTYGSGCVGLVPSGVVDDNIAGDDDDDDDDVIEAGMSYGSESGNTCLDTCVDDGRKFMEASMQFAGGQFGRGSLTESQFKTEEQVQAAVNPNDTAFGIHEDSEISPATSNGTTLMDDGDPIKWSNSPPQWEQPVLYAPQEQISVPKPAKCDVSRGTPAT